MWENDSLSFLQNKVIYVLKPLNKNSSPWKKKKLLNCVKHLNTLNYENKRTKL